ncbi:DUF6320 domain-containing protein [Ornithinibacillus scapharcae]|uniref:DUF6320 domain-containing protein n=1 Tax=Ornithinibacillus scapharcae TaxID=1147159 RepID=UPI000225B870|nr:DUF6320 domain-containing protein [Ornithinibacillus scapharcae]
MNYCHNCGVLIEHVTCPLCHRKVANPTDTIKDNLYPEYREMAIKKGYSFIRRIVTFISIVIISTCLLINFLVSPNHLWALYIVGAVIYLYVSINHTVYSFAHTGSKIVGQVISFSIMVILIDITSGFQRWSVNFVIPFLIITATLLITIIILFKRMRWQEYVGFILAMIVMGFLPIGLYISGIATTLWACAITSLYALLTLIGMLTFSNKTFKEEFVRRFHI